MNPKKSAILSLDLGSSSCKAMLVDEHGKEIAAGKAAYPIHYTPRQGEVEQDPDELWDGVCEAVHRLLQADASGAAIAAIALSSQMSSYFLIDAEHRPLCRILSWMDTRAAAEAGEMKAAFTPEQLYHMLGAELPVGPSWPIPKLRWLMRNRPEALARAKYIIQPKEWIVWRLTSMWMTDLSSARGMAHQVGGARAEPLFEWAGASGELLPPIGEPYSVAGLLLPAAAAALSLPAGIPVMLGWNDLNAAVLGAAGAADGTCGFDITGTSEHIGIVRPGISSRALIEGINHIPFGGRHDLYYGVTSSGGQALKWYVERIDQFEPGHAAAAEAAYSYEDVLSQAGAVGAGAAGLLFLPYLNGERSPWWNPAARGVFFGLHYTHDRRHMARAVLEGVGYALRTIVDRLPEAPRQFIAAGGSGRIPLWNQIKANILGIPVSCLESGEAGCLGAAILAAYGLGWYDSLEQASAHMIRTAETYEPDPREQGQYEQGYRMFTELYHSLVPIYEKHGRK